MCLNWIRKKKSSNFSQLNIDVSDDSVIDKIVDQAPLPSELFDHKNLQSILQKVILELPVRYRSVVILRYSQEFTFEEIADVLDLPVGTVKIHFFRAKKTV
ncbi:MAG: sigma-70 family RNA polymerase sigma factor [Actinobacteria bacterium]|nr:sigma-70 family RNA polymerase sigma factor [Actinomycetota bacterium]